MLDLNYILSTDNPLDTFRTLYSDVLVDKLNQMIKNCNDCGTSYEKQLYYGNSNANVMIINGAACSDKAINEYKCREKRSNKIDKQKIALHI